MKKESVILWISIFILLCSCNNNKQDKKKLTFDDCPQVAQRLNQDGGALVVCDMSQVKDTFNIPLSALLSSFEVIQLENTEEALTAVDGRVTISENYVSVYSFKAGAYKLYDRKGNYLSTLSSVGNGPDQYFIGLYDSYIDEKNRKVYILSFRATKILVFDFEGNALQHIPLPYIAYKGRFIVHPEKETLTLMVLPFAETPSVVWEQDFRGNVLQEIPVTDQFLISPSTYDNEVWESLNTVDVDFSLSNIMPWQDSLYHYQAHNNKLQPTFTIDFRENGISHNYIELPNHYLTWIFTQTSWQGERPRFPKILIDKETLRGCYVDFKIDKLGSIDGPNKISFSRGYFTAVMDSYLLKEQLEKALLTPEKMTTEMRAKIKKLNDSLTDDDNNILFIGKLRESKLLNQ